MHTGGFIFITSLAEAGNAFVESLLISNENQHKYPPANRGIFLPRPRKGSTWVHQMNHFRMTKDEVEKSKNEIGTDSSSLLTGRRGFAIQGYEGSFHQMAAQHFFGKNAQVIPCA